MFNNNWILPGMKSNVDYLIPKVAGNDHIKVFWVYYIQNLG